MPRLDNEQRCEMVGMSRANAIVAGVANHFSMSRECIKNLRNRLQATGTVNDRSRSGRSRDTAAAKDRHIHTMHLRNRLKLHQKRRGSFKKQMSFNGHCFEASKTCRNSPKMSPFYEGRATVLQG